MTMTMTLAMPLSEGKDALPPGQGRRMAYLLSSYPAISHTFLLNEITELRRLGFSIDVASVNLPAWGAGSLSAPVASALESTFYIKATPASRIASLLVKTLFLQPLVLMRGLRAALRLDTWNLRATGYALFYLIEALILGDWLRQRGHTHLHIHFGGPVATVGMLASAAWQIPYSIMIHGPDEFYDVDKFYLPAKIAQSEFVLCISDYCRSQVMKCSGTADWNKLHVVRLGVDHQVFSPVLRDSRPEELEILCVGRLVPAKGQLILLCAVSELLRRGHRLRLRLIGDGVDRLALESFIRDSNLEASVTLAGALGHQETRSHLANADIFVLASFAEGLPVALMEAMAMEVPCVSTLVAGIPELIRNGVDGLLVPPSSISALTSALERLIGDYGLRATLGASGRRRVLELYDLRKNVRSLAELLCNQLPCLANQSGPIECDRPGSSARPASAVRRLHS